MFATLFLLTIKPSSTFLVIALWKSFSGKNCIRKCLFYSSCAKQTLIWLIREYLMPKNRYSSNKYFGILIVFHIFPHKYKWDFSSQLVRSWNDNNSNSEFSNKECGSKRILDWPSVQSRLDWGHFFMAKRFGQLKDNSIGALLHDFMI